ncbi:hypothetical protein [Helicobacter sp. T3_23-1059]
MQILLLQITRERERDRESSERVETSAEIQEQIDAIKRENEMLKAKKAENNKIIKSGFLGFCRGKYEASGCFIGGEVGLAIQTEHYIWKAQTPKETEILGTPYKQTFNAPINLIFGYQWYYMQNQGLRVKANIGYANYNAKIVGDTYEAGFKWDYPTTTHAIQYGLELAWVWDFMRKGKHTLGLELSALGFEGMSYFSEFDFGGDVKPKGNFTKIAWTSRIGLHYYFNVNHQVALSYSYKSYSGITGAKMKVDDYDDGTLSVAPRNQILLSYAYKF